jgi:hypothetical protein
LGEPRRKQRDDENQHAERDDRSNQHCTVDYPIGPARNMLDRRAVCAETSAGGTCGK